MKKFRVGSHLRQEELEQLIIYIARHFSYLNTMFSVERAGNYYDLYWVMTPSQYQALRRAYLKDLDAGNID